jgi:hypothetical protein
MTDKGWAMPTGAIKPFTGMELAARRHLSSDQN